MAQLKFRINVIWSMCHKITFASSTTVSLAVNLAVTQFNLGKSVNILETLTGESAGPMRLFT